MNFGCKTCYWLISRHTSCRSSHEHKDQQAGDCMRSTVVGGGAHSRCLRRRTSGRSSLRLRRSRLQVTQHQTAIRCLLRPAGLVLIQLSHTSAQDDLSSQLLTNDPQVPHCMRVCHSRTKGGSRDDIHGFLHKAMKRTANVVSGRILLTGAGAAVAAAVRLTRITCIASGATLLSSSCHMRGPDRCDQGHLVHSLGPS